MPNFVRHVVDVEGVADRRSRSGHPLRLVARIAGTVEYSHAAATGTDHVADVVVGAADGAGEVVLVLRQHRGAIVVRVGIANRIGVDDRIVVRHQHHAHADLALVDAIDAIERGDDTGQTIDDAATMKCRVLAGGGHREAVGAQAGAGGDLGRGDRRLGIDRFARDPADGAFAMAVIELAINDVVIEVLLLERIDVPATLGTDDLSVEAAVRQVEAQRGARIFETLSEIGLELRILRRKRGLHDRRLDHAEGLVTAIGAWQGDLQRTVRRTGISLQWCKREPLLEATAIKFEGTVAARKDQARVLVSRDVRFPHLSPDAVVVGSRNGRPRSEKQPTHHDEQDVAQPSLHAIPTAMPPPNVGAEHGAGRPQKAMHAWPFGQSPRTLRPRHSSFHAHLAAPARPVPAHCVPRTAKRRAPCGSPRIKP